MPAKTVFISHAPSDNTFVLELHEKLAALGIGTWVDARELTGGGLLMPEIKRAIDSANYVIVVLSPNTINSTWVTKEVQYALKRQKVRTDGFKVIPILLPGINVTGLHHWFGKEPVGISVEIGPGGLDKAMPALLAALDERLPTFIPTVAPKPPAPVAELILELTDPTILQVDGQRRVAADATLIYNPANPLEREIRSRRYRFTAPLGPIETDDLTWYLEQYHRWPTSPETPLSNWVSRKWSPLPGIKSG